MKKIIFAILPLKGGLEKRKYPVDGNSLIESDKPIYYAVNPAIASNLKKDDEVKVFLIKTKGGENAGEENARKFEEELNEFNTVGASIKCETIETAFDPSKTNYKPLFKNLINNLEQDCEIYADVTYGPKPLAFLVLSAIQFAEKFFDATVGNIVYSKVEFIREKGADGKEYQKIKDGSEMIYDITPLYLINSFINVLDAVPGEKAIKSIDVLFEE